LRVINKFIAFNKIKEVKNEFTFKEFKKAAKNRKIILISAGAVCQEFIKKYYKKYTITAIVDSDLKKVNKEIMGIKIISWEEFYKIQDDFIILITSCLYNDELKNKLYPKYFEKTFSLLDMEINRRRIIRKFYMFRYSFLDGVFFSVAGLLRSLHFPIIYDKNAKKISEIRDKNARERCFIIAPGPSLSINDIEKLTHEVTFGLNKVYKIFNNTSWRPTYYALLDPKTLPEYDKYDSCFNIEDLAQKEIFLASKLKQYSKKYNNSSIIYIPTFSLDQVIQSKYEKLKYNDNLLAGHYNAYTVVNFVINIAQYMGIREIYLLGVDCNYSGNQHYFDGSTNLTVNSTQSASKIQLDQIAGYKFIKKETEKKGIKIYNATRGGALEIFERVDFDSLFKEGNDV